MYSEFSELNSWMKAVKDASECRAVRKLRRAGVQNLETHLSSSLQCVEHNCLMRSDPEGKPTEFRAMIPEGGARPNVKCKAQGRYWDCL